MLDGPSDPVKSVVVLELAWDDERADCHRNMADYIDALRKWVDGGEAGRVAELTALETRMIDPREKEE